MVRPFKMTILSSPYIPLLGQGLLLLHSAHVTDLPISLPQVSATIVVTLDWNSSTMIAYQGVVRGRTISWFPW